MTFRTKEQALIAHAIMQDVIDLRAMAHEHQLQEFSPVLGACQRQIFSLLMEKLGIPNNQKASRNDGVRKVKSARRLR